eukprot:COSAG02_NODE_1081_length_14706_cov_994.783939_14_plen_143_part_00
MQVAIVPSRERMMQGLRYYRTDAFDVDTVHAQCHNGEPPASLVCDDGAPRRIVLGLKGANASKNGFFAEIPIDTPVLHRLLRTDPERQLSQPYAIRCRYDDWPVLSVHGTLSSFGSVTVPRFNACSRVVAPIAATQSSRVRA